MWDHLDAPEKQRRLEALAADMDVGGLPNDAFGPRDILGLWAWNQGDVKGAYELWTPDYGEYVEGLCDPRTPLTDLLDAADIFQSWEDVSRNPCAPLELLRLIWDEAGPSAELAEHPQLPMELLDNILDQDEDVIMGAAQNAALSENIYQLLRDYESPDPWRPWTELRVALVGNPANTPEQLALVQPVTQSDLDSFSGQGDEVYVEEDKEINVAHARHPCTPLETLEALSHDLHSEVRAAVAKNPRCPQAVLKQLANDPSIFVRSAVLSNTHSSEEVRDLAARVEQSG